MKVEMMKLNKVKYAYSEEQKKELMNKGYQPVAASKKAADKKETATKASEEKDA